MQLLSKTDQSDIGKKTQKTLVVLLGTFVLAFTFLAYFFHGYTEDYAIKEAEKLVRDALLTHKAVHKYVNNQSRPELYRLKSEGKLYQNYFSPKTMSFTYTARGIKRYLNEERKILGIPEVYFKLATINPRNEINEADVFERKLLKQMNENDLEEFTEIQENQSGEKSLYFAMPTKPITKNCLKCHGYPEDAPREMVEKYPNAAGYYENKGDIRALISIKVPLKSYLEDGKSVSKTLTLVTFGVFVFIYSLMFFFITKSHRQQMIIMKKNKELERVSITDFLTKINNRMGFIQLTEHAFAVARRYQRPFSLIMLDVDYFKKINDTFGHKKGDLVLQELAGLVNQCLRASDIFGRFGGEEFIIASEEQNKVGAYALADKIRKSVAEHKFADELQTTISLGVVEWTDEKDLAELINKADSALYDAKNAGRNRVISYNAEQCLSLNA